eukprot:4111205-Prymnesium_polylepis.1
MPLSCVWRELLKTNRVFRYRPLRLYHAHVTRLDTAPPPRADVRSAPQRPGDARVQGLGRHARCRAIPAWSSRR